MSTTNYHPHQCNHILRFFSTPWTCFDAVWVFLAYKNWDMGHRTHSRRRKLLFCRNAFLIWTTRLTDNTVAYVDSHHNHDDMWTPPHSLHLHCLQPPTQRNRYANINRRRNAFFKNCTFKEILVLITTSKQLSNKSGPQSQMHETLFCTLPPKLCKEVPCQVLGEEYGTRD